MEVEARKKAEDEVKRLKAEVGHVARTPTRALRAVGPLRRKALPALPCCLRVPLQLAETQRHVRSIQFSRTDAPVVSARPLTATAVHASRSATAAVLAALETPHPNDHRNGKV